jgi:hypothetical protein
MLSAGVFSVELPLLDAGKSLETEGDEKVDETEQET